MCYPWVLHKGSHRHPALYSYQITIQKSDWSLIEVRFIKTSALIAVLLQRSFLNTLFSSYKDIHSLDYIEFSWISYSLILI